MDLSKNNQYDSRSETVEMGRKLHTAANDLLIPPTSTQCNDSGLSNVFEDQSPQLHTSTGVPHSVVDKLSLMPASIGVLDPRFLGGLDIFYRLF